MFMTVFVVVSVVIVITVVVVFRVVGVDDYCYCWVVIKKTKKNNAVCCWFVVCFVVNGIVVCLFVINGLFQQP